MDTSYTALSFGNVGISGSIFALTSVGFIIHLVVLFNADICCSPSFVGCLATCYARNSIILTISLLICAGIMALLLAAGWIYFRRYRVRNDKPIGGREDVEKQSTHFKYMTHPLNTSTHYAGVVVSGGLVIVVAVIIATLGFTTWITDTAHLNVLNNGYLFVMVTEMIILYISVMNGFLFF